MLAHRSMSDSDTIYNSSSSLLVDTVRFDPLRIVIIFLNVCASNGNFTKYIILYR